MNRVRKLLLAVALLLPITAQATLLTFDDATTAELNPYQFDGYMLQATILPVFSASFTPNLGQSDTFNFGRSYLSVDDTTASGLFIGSAPLVTISRIDGTAFDLNSIDLGSKFSSKNVDLNISSIIMDSSGSISTISQFITGVNELSNYMLSGFIGVTSVRISAAVPFGVIGSSEPNSSFSFDNIDLTANNISTVPIPAAAWLFGSALLGFFGFSRRKEST